MKLTFLGTRGEIEARTLERQRPAAIVVIHAHPDHAWGLRDGAPCPVWATEDVDLYIAGSAASAGSTPSSPTTARRWCCAGAAARG